MHLIEPAGPALHNKGRFIWPWDQCNACSISCHPLPTGYTQPVRPVANCLPQNRQASKASAPMDISYPPPLRKHAESQETGGQTGSRAETSSCLCTTRGTNRMYVAKNLPIPHDSTIVATGDIYSVVMELHQHNIYTFCQQKSVPMSCP